MNTACGLDPATADIRRPSVSWDGTLIAFAARSSASDPLADLHDERRRHDVRAARRDQRRRRPPATASSSTTSTPSSARPTRTATSASSSRRRAATSPTTRPYDYSGPQRTPADPSKPNANLYVYEPDPNNAAAAPHPAADLPPRHGAATRASWRTGASSSRPRSARRASTSSRSAARTSTAATTTRSTRSAGPSATTRRATSWSSRTRTSRRSSATRATPHGGGSARASSIARSASTSRAPNADRLPRRPDGHRPDVAVVARAELLPPLAVVPRSERERARGAARRRRTRRPSALPDGNILVSFGSGGDPATSAATTTSTSSTRRRARRRSSSATRGRPRSMPSRSTRARRRGIFSADGRRAERRTRRSTPAATEADVTVLDMPVLASLLFQNTPTGRVVEPDPSFDVYEDLASAAVTTPLSSPRAAATPRGRHAAARTRSTCAAASSAPCPGSQAGSAAPPRPGRPAAGAAPRRRQRVADRGTCPAGQREEMTFVPRRRPSLSR